MFRRFPARQNAVGKGERQMGLYALRGEACATLGDGGSGCRKPVFCRTRRVCTGEGEVCRNPGAGVGELCTPGCFAGAEGDFELRPVRAAAWACCGTGPRCRRGVFPRLLRQGRGGSLEEVTPRSTYPPDTDFHEAVEARGKKQAFCLVFCRLFLCAS